MAALLIKNLPESLHKKLKIVAAQHHRSMTQEVLVLLEEALSRSVTVEELGQPLKGKFKITQKFLNEAKRKGRA